MIKKTLAFLLLTTLGVLSVYAQNNWTSSSKKAVKYLEEGLKQMGLGYNDQAAQSINKAIKADAHFPEAFLSMGQLLENQGQYAEAAEFYKKGHDARPGLFKQTFMSVGRANYLNGNYVAAKEAFKSYLQQKNISLKSKAKVKKYIENCVFAIHAMKTPLPYNPIDVGENINTEYHEYWPSLTADEEIMVYTSRLPIDPNYSNVGGLWQEDFFESVYRDSAWQKGMAIPPPLNTPENEGAQSLSVDGRTLYFTACNREDGLGRCDIYYTEWDDGNWTKPENLGSPVNTAYNEKQPSISSDGSTLYFVSGRNGGFGKMDVWKCEKTVTGKWGKPVNLGDSVNSIEDEQAPFIHADNRTLYFTSNGRTGMGGNDLYFSKRKDNGTFSSAINLGYPVNTINDEMGLMVNAKGDKAYFSTDRIKERGLDIYYFQLPDHVKPLPVSYMKGIIFNAVTKQKLQAFFQIIDITSGDTVSASKSDKKSGGFLITIPTEKSYLMNVSKKGYMFYSEHFEFKGNHSEIEPMVKNIPLQPIEINSLIVLNNVFYETGSYLLRKESKIELNKVIEFLSLNPNVKIEIGGHTDNVGSKEDNKDLSQKRAEGVVAYLVNNGIEKKRLTATGYGEEVPVENNYTEVGRGLNRRTELKIIGL